MSNVNFMIYFACEALDIYTTVKHCGTVNVSQQIDRMTHGDEKRVQCITPSAILWHMPSKRPLSGRGFLNFICTILSVDLLLVFDTGEISDYA